MESRYNSLDEYSFRHLFSHFIAEGLNADLLEMLLEYDWLQSKLNVTDVDALLSDYRLVSPDDEGRIIEEALRLSRHILMHDKGQLASQLLGVLLDNKQLPIQELLRQAKILCGERTWLRPIIASLTPTGGSELRTLTGHEWVVTALALTRDGRKAISADKTLKVWDLTDPDREPFTLTGHLGFVRAIALSKDGQIAISASDDKTLRVWDMSDLDAEPYILKGHTDKVNGVALTANGQLAVSASSDRTLRLWNLTALETDPVVLQLSNEATAVAIALDEKIAISSLVNNTFVVWDLNNPSLEPRFIKCQGEREKPVAITNDGHLLFSEFEGNLAVWDLTNPDVYSYLPPTPKRLRLPDGLASVAITDDYSRAIVSLRSIARCQLVLCDLDVPIFNSKTYVLGTHAEEITAIAINANGQIALSGSADKTIKIWQLSNFQPELARHRHHDAEVSAVAISSDGKMAVSASDDRTLHIWDTANPEKEPWTIKDTASVLYMMLAPDGKKIIYATAHSVNVVDLFSKDTWKTNYLDCIVLTFLGILDDHRVLFLSGDYQVKEWDLAVQDREPRPLFYHNGAEKACVTSDGRRFVSYSAYEKTIKFWDLIDGSYQSYTSPEEEPVSDLALSLDGQVFIAAFTHGMVKVWDMTRIETGPRVFYGHDDDILAITLTSKGDRAISASWDKTLKVWDLAHPNIEPQTLIGHKEGVIGVRLTQDDRLAISTSKDRSIKIWDVNTCQCLATFTTRGVVGCMASTSDGQRIIIGDSTGCVHLLDLEGRPSLIG